MKNNRILILMSIFSLLLYPVDATLSFILCFATLILTLIVDKDKLVLNKVMQPTLALSAVFALKGLLLLFLGIITNFAYLSDSYYSMSTSSSNFLHVLEALLILFVLIMFVVISIMFVLKKDVPGLDKLSRMITNTEEKPAKKETKKSDIEIDDDKKDTANNNASVKSKESKSIKKNK